MVAKVVTLVRAGLTWCVVAPLLAVATGIAPVHGVFLLLTDSGFDDGRTASLLALAASVPLAGVIGTLGAVRRLVAAVEPGTRPADDELTRVVGDRCRAARVPVPRCLVATAPLADVLVVGGLRGTVVTVPTATSPGEAADTVVHALRRGEGMVVPQTAGLTAWARMWRRTTVWAVSGVRPGAAHGTADRVSRLVLLPLAPVAAVMTVLATAGAAAGSLLIAPASRRALATLPDPAAAVGGAPGGAAALDAVVNPLQVVVAVVGVAVAAVSGSTLATHVAGPDEHRIAAHVSQVSGGSDGRALLVDLSERFQVVVTADGDPEVTAVARTARAVRVGEPATLAVSSAGDTSARWLGADTVLRSAVTVLGGWLLAAGLAAGVVVASTGRARRATTGRLGPVLAWSLIGLLPAGLAAAVVEEVAAGVVGGDPGLTLRRIAFFGVGGAIWLGWSALGLAWARSAGRSGASAGRPRAAGRHAQDGRRAGDIP